MASKLVACFPSTEEILALLVQQGKGRWARVLPLCQEAVPPLMECAALRRTLTRCRQDPLFMTDQHQRVGDNTLRHLLEEIKAIAGMREDPRVKPHSIHHAAATRMLRNGADIESIRALLGHSLLQTASIYLHGSEHQVRKVIETVGLARDAEGAVDRGRRSGPTNGRTSCSGGEPRPPGRIGEAG